MQTGRGMQSIQIWFQATECWWKGKECCLKETSPDRPWDGLWKIQNCYRRRSSTRPVSQKKLPDNFVCSCSDVGRQRWCQHLTKIAFGGVSTLGIEWAIAMTTQPSLTKMKTLTACKQALWDKSQANKMREQGAGKESESSLCPPPPTASPLTRMFACHLKWRGCSQFITFLGNRACLVFGEPDYFRNSEKNFVHVSFFTQIFNQHLTINNIAALTCARLKESWHKCDIRTPTCMLQ